MEINHQLAQAGKFVLASEAKRPVSDIWAEELRDHCRTKDVAFFLKQLGWTPSRNGKVFHLQHAHGGNWDELPNKALKIREFPEAFHVFRRHEMKPSNDLRPTSKIMNKGV